MPMTQEELNKKINDAEEQLSLLKKLQNDIDTNITELTETLGQVVDDPDGAAKLQKQIDDLTLKKQTVNQQTTALEDLIAQYKTMTPTNEVADAKQANTMSEEEKARNAALAAQHPERVVDGIYYANDEALAKAKAAYEERIKAEAQKANAEASAKVSNLAATMVAINKTLYGTDNAEVLAQLQGQVGGAELSSVLGNATTVRARQHLLNFKEFKHDFKAPNAGKPPQNKDPFPVDQKIEEFEYHLPKVKVKEATTHNHGLDAMVVALMQFDATEKRLVKELRQT